MPVQHQWWGWNKQAGIPTSKKTLLKWWEQAKLDVAASPSCLSLPSQFSWNQKKRLNQQRRMKNSLQGDVGCVPFQELLQITCRETWRPLGSFVKPNIPTEDKSSSFLQTFVFMSPSQQVAQTVALSIHVMIQGHFTPESTAVDPLGPAF